MQIDDEFLDDLGLGDLPADQRASLKTHVYETLELRVGEMLSDGMSDAELREFESIIDRDVATIANWLDIQVPDFLDDPLFARMSRSVGEDVAKTALICEYAATKWLEMHRPDYRDIVSKITEEIKAEVRDHAAQILGA